VKQEQQRVAGNAHFISIRQVSPTRPHYAAAAAAAAAAIAAAAYTAALGNLLINN